MPTACPTAPRSRRTVMLPGVPGFTPGVNSASCTNGRSFVQLALLTPGVNPGTPGSITVRRLRGAVGQAVGMSANGARDTQNRFYYDGIEAMDLDSYSFSFSPSIDAINEFKVQSSTYSAEVGGAPGGQVNLTTRG